MNRTCVHNVSHRRCFLNGNESINVCSSVLLRLLALHLSARRNSVRFSISVEVYCASQCLPAACQPLIKHFADCSIAGARDGPDRLRDEPSAWARVWCKQRTASICMHALNDIINYSFIKRFVAINCVARCSRENCNLHYIKKLLKWLSRRHSHDDYCRRAKFDYSSLTFHSGANLCLRWIF